MSLKLAAAVFPSLHKSQVKCVCVCVGGGGGGGGG